MPRIARGHERLQKVVQRARGVQQVVKPSSCVAIGSSKKPKNFVASVLYTLEIRALFRAVSSPQGLRPLVLAP